VKKRGQLARAGASGNNSRVGSCWPGRVHVPESAAEGGAPGESGRPKRISLLGCTGSIGTQTVEIVQEHPERFEIVGLSAGSNVDLAENQIRTLNPSLVSMHSPTAANELRSRLSDLPSSSLPEILEGIRGACFVASHPHADCVVTGIVGCAGLQPTVSAIKAGKDICLANKETLIAGGPHIVPLVKQYGVNMLPADSEHSALFQCMHGLVEPVRRITLTASGGAFRDHTASELKSASHEWLHSKATTHPTWNMGAKITCDSATLMNKALEVIEAHYLFGCDYDNIEVMIHPQSIVHSLIETRDSSVLSQLGWPDMRLPILYTLSWPHRVPTSEETWPRLDLRKANNLNFKEPDSSKYPTLPMGYTAGRAGGTMPCFFSAANERAVELFLDNHISYFDIFSVLEKAMDAHQNENMLSPSLEDIVHFDAKAREYVDSLVLTPSNAASAASR